MLGRQARLPCLALDNVSAVEGIRNSTNSQEPQSAILRLYSAFSHLYGLLKANTSYIKKQQAIKVSIYLQAFTQGYTQLAARPVSRLKAYYTLSYLLLITSPLISSFARNMPSNWGYRLRSILLYLSGSSSCSLTHYLVSISGTCYLGANKAVSVSRGPSSQQLIQSAIFAINMLN